MSPLKTGSSLFLNSSYLHIQAHVVQDIILLRVQLVEHHSNSLLAAFDLRPGSDDVQRPLDLVDAHPSLGAPLQRLDGASLPSDDDTDVVAQRDGICYDSGLSPVC